VKEKMANKEEKGWSVEAQKWTQQSLPMRYDAKVSTLEDQENLDKLTMDELHGILIAYEMRIGQENSSKGKQPSKHQKQLRTMSLCQMKIGQTY
jgi:hypothetical protein